MSFVKEIFKTKPKAPRELVSATVHLLEQLKTRMEGKVMEKTVEEISKHLLTMKGILFGDGENEPDAEHVQALGLEIESSNLVVSLLASISQLDFESRKDAVLVLSHMLRRHCPSTSSLLLANFDIVTDMITRYDSKEAALNFGSALRECIRVPALAQRLLQTRAWSRLLQHVESCRFDVSTDSFLTLKELLTKHKTAVAEHLERNFDDFFSEYRNLLLSQNYVARRQLLRLLGELLGDRCNFKIMTRLIADVDLLKVRTLRGCTAYVSLEDFVFTEYLTAS
jgi:calcium binding protein 39